MVCLASRVAKLERARAARRIDPKAAATLAAIRADRAAVLTRAGVRPDPWQAELLRGSWTRALVLASRQVGKSETAAAVALHTVLTTPGALVLLTAPSLRQAVECYRKAADQYARLGRPVPGKVNATFLQLANRARLIAVPGTEKTIRGFSAVTLVVVDEAARVPDALMTGLRPALAVSGGRLLACTTPFGQRGWFYSSWSGDERWERFRVNADHCPRITPAFLADERRALGERAYRQEYCTSFEDTVGAVFSHDDIVGAAVDEPPLFTQAA